MTLRPSLAVSWPSFVAEWCLGVEPLVSQEDLTRALEALERLWPEYLDELEASGASGLLRVHPAARVGSILASCEPLLGFAPILARIKLGERAALSELIFADALLGLGIVPVLEPALGNNKLDVDIPYEGETIYAEVVTPGRSDAISEAQEQISALSRALVPRCVGLSVELLLDPSAALGTIADIAAAVEGAPVAEPIQELPGIGQLLKRPATPTFSPSIHTRNGVRSWGPRVPKYSQVSRSLWRPSDCQSTMNGPSACWPASSTIFSRSTPICL